MKLAEAEMVMEVLRGHPPEAADDRAPEGGTERRNQQLTGDGI